MGNRIDQFRQRLRSGELIAGSFLKTPSPIAAEVMALTALDVHCIDAEHAPFGRLETDACVAAYRAADVPVLVRVASDSPHELRAALDCGASGVLVPHVCSAEQARAVVRACRFGEGGRGYAGSPRAAAYTRTPMPQHRQDSDTKTSIIVQIEDTAALDNVTEICAVEGVDAVFVGRVDLAVAMDKSVLDDKVVSVVSDVCRKARDAGTTVGMFTPRMEELADWKRQGASLFLLGSDQSFILSAGDRLAADIKEA